MDAQDTQRLLIGVASIMITAVGGLQELASIGLARLVGLPKSLGDKIRGQGNAQGPADDLATEQINVHGQIDPTSSGGQVAEPARYQLAEALNSGDLLAIGQV